MEHKALFKTEQKVMQSQPIQIWLGILQGTLFRHYPTVQHLLH